MQTNRWEAFLSDQELIDSKEYHRLLNGEYLFGKTCHDALECLNNYLAILSLMVSNDSVISTISLHWFASKKGVIETAVAEIYSVGERSRELLDSSKEWPALIKLVGSKLGEVQTLADNFYGFDESDASTEIDLVTMAIANLRGVQAIYADIQAENYKQLLTTPKYYL
jgi:hypothetical protein